LNNQVWVCGEVLIDLIQDEINRKVVMGGGPANTAKALARLGIKTQFIDGISTDNYGQFIIQQLYNDGVLLDFIKILDKPTCLAVVNLNDQRGAVYDFMIEGTATFDFSPEWLPDPNLNKPALLHIGTLVTVIEPAASILLKWAKKVANIAPVIFDPNVRPSVMNNRRNYVFQVEKWIEISSAVKVSEDDIKWLYPNNKIKDIIKKWLNSGPELVVVTHGAKGLSAFSKDEKIHVNAKKVRVEDTVGAGDTVGAVLIEAILKLGLENLRNKSLELMLERASKAASITVSRVGAQPPKKNEI
jgi:fructokinase